MEKYWKLLGLEPTAMPEEIVAAWKNLPNTMGIDFKPSPELLLFTKAQLDPYYCETLKFYPDLNQLLPSGFFDDGKAPEIKTYRTDLFTTPVAKIIHNLNQLKISIQTGYETKKPYLVLLNTGSYSPLHLGHLQMMEEARECLQEQYHVLGGYLSPSHDGYVSTKYQGTAALNSDIRISLCQEVLADSDWLSVDPWEARYNSGPINFTDVIIRLKKYLKRYTGLDIEVGYVFGSDNAGFTWAFIEEGISVCFERPGYELPFQTVSQDTHLDYQRHFFIKTKGNTYSSKAIREGATEFLPEKIKKIYYQYKSNSYPVYSNIYLVRNDSHYCTDFIDNPKKGFLLDKFTQQLSLWIKQCFQNNMQVHFLDVKQQQSYLNSEIFSQSDLINVDLWTKHPRQHTLGISRLFEVSDGQVFSHNLIGRPGMPSLEDQLSKIPPNNYTLVDDDIASGRTVKMITDSLPPSVCVTELVALSQQSFHQELGFDISYQFHDIVDVRDFIFGSKSGGLVVNLPNGKIGRVPYIWPYISLNHRAKIPHNQEYHFTIEILKMNLDFFSQLQPLRVEDMDANFIQFCQYLGFDMKTPMTQWCQFHLDKLIR